MKVFIICLIVGILGFVKSESYENENFDDNSEDHSVFDKILAINQKSARSRSGRKEKYFQGDIVMTKSIEEMIENRKRGAASANDRHNWPFNPGNGKYEIPYVIDRSVSRHSKNSKLILGAMREWMGKVKCFSFVRRTNQRGYLKFASGNGCSSRVGYQGREQIVTLGGGCMSHGIIVHEIGHALGFWHEQSRRDRDKYITIHFENIRKDSRKNNPMLVSASNVGTIKIWDLKTYQEIRTLDVLQTYVTSIAVSGDKKYIISGYDEGSVRLWCFHTGKSLSCYEGHTMHISGVAIIPNAKKVLTASLDGSIRVWNLGTATYMEQNSLSDHSNDVTDITMSSDDSRCVSTSKDRTLKVWNLHTHAQCFSVRGDLKWAKHVAVSADDQYVVSLSKDGILFSTKSSIKVWNLSDGSVINGIDSDGSPEIVRFSSDGLQVIIGCKDNHVFIWDWQNPDASLKEVILPASYTVEIACDRNMIYTCSLDMHICEINLDSLQVSTVRQRPRVPHVISPDGKNLLFGSLQKNVFLTRKLSTDNWIDHNAGHPDESIVTAIDITSNGKFALSGSSSGTLSLVDMECSKKVQFAKTESGGAIRFVCLLSDDVRFVFVDEVNRIELRTFNDIEASMKLGQPEVEVTCITALGSNYALLGCDDGELLWFHLSNDRQLKFPAHEDAISQVRGELGDHDRSRRFASGSIGGSVKLWKVEDNLPTLIWSHDHIRSHSITALQFVPCSDDIIIASNDQVARINAKGIVQKSHVWGRIETIRVVQNFFIGVYSRLFKYGVANGADEKTQFIEWELDEEEWELNEEWDYENSELLTRRVLRVNNSGSHVAILGRGSLVIENFITGKVLYRFPIQNAERIRALALSPAGKFLLSCSIGDKTLKLWNLPNEECVEEFHFDQDVLAIACGSHGMVCVGLAGGRVCFLRLNKLSSHSKELQPKG